MLPMTGNILRIGCCAFAVLLLGAVGTQPTIAAHRHGHHGHHAKGSRHSAGQNGTQPARAHHVLAARPANHDLRNAIGMRITAAKDGQGGSGWPSGRVPRVPEADRTALGIGRNGPGGIAKPGDNSARSNVGQFKPIHPNAYPGVVPIALNRGMLGGAQFVRPGFAPSRLGGPAHALVRIDGTTVQPKH